MPTQTTALNKLQEALAKLEQQYKSTYRTPEAIYALMKTIKTFNITITDWNTLIDYINVVGLTLDSLYAIVPEIVMSIGGDVCVNLFSDQNISGTKTFVDKIKVPTPIDYTDATSKEYVDKSITKTQQTAQQYTDDSVQALKDLVNENYAEKTYVNQGLNSKVNRIVSYQGDYLYGVYNGTDKVYEVKKQAVSDSIVQRTGNANIVVPLTPAADDCATSKQYVNNSISSAISRVYKPQGTVTVDILNSLTITKEMNGYVYDISDTGTLTKGSVQVIQGDNVAIIWNEDETDWKWDKLSSIVDLSNYATKKYVNDGLETKADITYVDNAIEQAITNVLTEEF